MLQILVGFGFIPGIGGTPQLPVNVTHAAADIADSVDRTNYTSGAFTPNAGDLIVAFVRVPGTPPATLPVMTGSAGLTFTRVASSSNTTFMFIANQLAQGVSQTLNVSFGADTAQGCLMSADRVSGMIRTGAAALRQSQNGSGGGGTTPALTFPASTLSINPILCCAGSVLNPPNLTPPTDFTETADIGITTPANGLQVCHIAGGFAGTTVTYGAASAQAWRGIFGELDASIPGAIGAGVHLIRRRRRGG